MIVAQYIVIILLYFLTFTLNMYSLSFFFFTYLKGLTEKHWCREDFHSYATNMSLLQQFIGHVTNMIMSYIIAVKHVPGAM